MILNWVSSKEVVSRIFRNMKGVQAEYADDIMEWIPEAMLKMKTQYSVQVRKYELDVVNHLVKIPCRIEGIVSVMHKGCRLNYNDRGQIRHHHPNSAGISVFQSILPIYTSSGDTSPATNLVPANAALSPFPRDFVEDYNVEWDTSNWYKINGKFLETSIESGDIKVWIQEIVKDEEGYPMVPDNEYVGEAIYRYCRMMLIEAGYEDRIINHRDAIAMWTDAAGKAISDTCFPTPDQVESSIHRHLDNFFPDGYEIYDNW